MDMVRPGMCLYGMNPLPKGRGNPMSHAVTVTVPVICTREVPSGTPVGYNRTFHTKRPSVLITCRLGYGDGIFRNASSTDQTLSGVSLVWTTSKKGEERSYRCPIVGRISMDLLVVDVTDVPNDLRPVEGDSMELIGKNQSLEEIADTCSTIPHEILTAMGRLHREYLPAPERLKAPPKQIVPRAASYIYALTDLLHKLLTENGVRYYLEGGSMLGQVRDGGIIKFDDDADVQIHHEDTQRLIDAIPKIEQGIDAWARLTHERVHLRKATFGYKLILEPDRQDEAWQLYFDTLGGCWAPGFAIVDLFLTELSDDRRYIKYSDSVIEQQVRGRGYGDIEACRLNPEEGPILGSFGPIEAFVLNDAQGACCDVFGDKCLSQVCNKDGTSFEKRASVLVDYDAPLLTRLMEATAQMDGIGAILSEVHRLSSSSASKAVSAAAGSMVATLTSKLAQNTSCVEESSSNPTSTGGAVAVASRQVASRPTPIRTGGAHGNSTPGSAVGIRR